MFEHFIVTLYPSFLDEGTEFTLPQDPCLLLQAVCSYLLPSSPSPVYQPYLTTVQIVDKED